MTELRKEMTKRKITVAQMANTLGIWRETLQRKVQGERPFLLKEALLLHETYFSERDFVELFADYK